MKILFIHNKYKYQGGEDSVFRSEIKLLQKNYEQISTLIYHNDVIVSFFDKFKYGAYSFYNPESSIHLKEKIEEFAPDIIHIHNFFPIGSPSLFFVAQKYNIPVIMTLHNYRLLCPNAMFFRNGSVCEVCLNKSFPFDGVLHGCYRNSKIETLSLASMIWLHKVMGTWHHKIDRYIVLTNFAKNKFIHSSLQLPENKIEVKPNFVEDRGFNLEKEDYFLFVGRLSEEKGIDVLLNAFKTAEKKLHVIGNGPLENKVKTEAQNNENIVYHGFKSIDFIIDKLKKAKALVFTSILYEGMPMSILEAFSTGTPVICGNIGGPSEIVKDKINGLIYETGNAFALKQKIDWLDKHPDEALILSKNARNSYEEYYCEQKNYEQLMKIYKDVVDEKKKSHQ